MSSPLRPLRLTSCLRPCYWLSTQSKRCARLLTVRTVGVFQFLVCCCLLACFPPKGRKTRLIRHEAFGEFFNPLLRYLMKADPSRFGNFPVWSSQSKYGRGLHGVSSSCPDGRRGLGHAAAPRRLPPQPLCQTQLASCHAGSFWLVSVLRHSRWLGFCSTLC